MSSPDTSRLFVFITLQRSSLLPSLHRDLHDMLANGSDVAFQVHLAARHFPSTWGRVSRAQPVHADPDTLSPEQLKEWQGWVSSGRLGLIPAGYAGAFPAVLTRDEAHAEIEWAVSNGWKSGFRDCFGQSPPLCLPLWTSPADDEWQAFALQHFSGVGLGKMAGKHPRLVIITRDGPAALPFVELDGESAQAMADQMRDAARQAPEGDIAVRLSYEDRPGLLTSLSEALMNLVAAGFPVTSTPVFRPWTEPLPELLPLISPQPVIGPDFRHLLHQLPEGRKGRSATQERLRTQLLTCLPQDSTHRIPVQAAPELLNRSLLANMEGEATIMADGFESRFAHGHWRGLFPSGDPAAPGIRMRDPSGASLVIRGKTWHYEVESSVSFETDHSRGLRNALVLKMPGSHIPGRMMMDYVLSDHSPHLLIDIQIRYPWLEDTPLIDEVHPCRLGMELPDDCRNLAISCQHLQEPPREFHPFDTTDPGEGSPSPRQQGWWQRLLEPLRHQTGESRPTCRWEKVFYGNRWTVTWEHGGKRQGLAILRLPGERNASAPLEMRLNQESNGRGLTLELFPEGRYRKLPNADLRSLNHHFVLGVLPIFDPYAPIPELHDRVEKDCSPFFMIRES